MPHSLTGEEMITRVGAFKDDEGKVHLIPDSRMSTLGKMSLVPGEMDNPPTARDVMGPLLTEFVKKGTAEGLDSQMRDTLVRASRTRSGSASPCPWSTGKGSCFNLDVLSDSDRGTDDGRSYSSDSSSSDEGDGAQEDSDKEVTEEEDSDVEEVDEEDSSGGSMSRKSGARKGATGTSAGRPAAASARKASKHPGAAADILNLAEDGPAGRPAQGSSSKSAAAANKHPTSKRAGAAGAPVDLASDNSKKKEGSADGGKGKKGKADGGKGKKGKGDGSKAKKGKGKAAKDKGDKGLMHARLTESREDKATLDTIAKRTSREAEEERQTAYKAFLEAERVRGSRAKALEARAHKGIEEAKQAAQVATKDKSDAKMKRLQAKKDTNAKTSTTTASSDHASASTGFKRKDVTPAAPPVGSDKKKKKPKKSNKPDANVQIPGLDPAQVAALMQMMQRLQGGGSSSGTVRDASSESDSDSASVDSTANKGHPAGLVR
ncbi:hypothetical protein Esi_0377_0007 [Ectocarpus siliculosus]|uniref:Uncharacterized protein n=1 Tax=Ectocarpus siliculosus TaxID=2880 RepID=D7FZL2_ECTSI|nr:hypothetical protein Esi_0377_0007 [Ectocarpus siliculosus]|eukprot:CBJ32819.1 hypothetical protein Esi_0377_0007 [Ectocarpus siliculosus]